MLIQEERRIVRAQHSIPISGNAVQDSSRKQEEIHPPNPSATQNSDQTKQLAKDFANRNRILPEYKDTVNPEAPGGRTRNPTDNKAKEERTRSVNPFDLNFNREYAEKVSETVMEEEKRQASQVPKKNSTKPPQNQSPYNLVRQDAVIANHTKLKTETPSSTNPFESPVELSKKVSDFYQNQNNSMGGHPPKQGDPTNPQASQAVVVQNSSDVSRLSLSITSELELPSTLFIETVPLLTESQNQFSGLMYGLGKDYSDLYLRQGEGIVKSLYKSN